MSYPGMKDAVKHPRHMRITKDPVKLTIIRGMPGSGKSYHARKLSLVGAKKIRIVEFDDFWKNKKGEYKFDPEIVMSCVEYARAAVTHELLIEERPCIITGVFNRLEYMDYFRALCDTKNIPLEVLRMTGNYGNIHGVPEDKLKEMRDTFEDCEGEITVK